jgi:hypothetical protein
MTGGVVSTTWTVLWQLALLVASSVAVNVTAVRPRSKNAGASFVTVGVVGSLFAVLISNNNGAGWVAVDTLRGLGHNEWEERAIRVADVLTPTSTMRVRFIATDLSPGTVVEAAVDEIVVYDAAQAFVGAPAAALPAALRFRAPAPNPARGAVSLALDVPRAAELRVEVLDVGGRRVRTLHRGAAPAGELRLVWDGVRDGGRRAPAGLYFIRATAPGACTSTRVVRID